MSTSFTLGNSNEDTMKLLADIFGTSSDTFLDDPALVSQLIEAAARPSSPDDLRATFPSLWDELRKDRELRDSYDLYVALEATLMAEQEVELETVATRVNPLRDIVARGKQWVLDSVGTVAIMLTPGPEISTDGAVLRSDSGGQEYSERLLQQVSLSSSTTLGNWDVTATVLSDGADRCQVEVSLFNMVINADLSGIPVTLTLGDDSITDKTDENGSVVFSDIAQSALHDAVLHIRLGLQP